MKRRDFLQFLGATGLSISVLNLKGCAGNIRPANFNLPPTLDDKITTIDGLDYDILIRWGDSINKNQTFGFNNDFIAFHSLAENQAILWVNHEYVHPLFINGMERNKTNINKERLEVGGSLIEIRRNDSQWRLVANSPFNRRIDATTPIPLAWPHPIMGAQTAIGTLANCAGGKTPWNTFLSCEENYDMFLGERDSTGKITKSWLQWEDHYPLPPEHYGWVVEIEPLTGKSKKLISLGRFAHECASITKTKSGKAVAYTGDDAVNEHLYKFISNSDSSLEDGKLYVANLEKGHWISLHRVDQPILRKHFKDQTDVLIHARKAAKLVGATPLDRPEDIEFDPLTGNVLIALTNNKPRNMHGSILKIIEDNSDPGSLSFTHETFLHGGVESGFSCPDNMVFDLQGNLWFTTDMSGQDIQNGTYREFGNNSLFVFIRKGNLQGQVIRVASAPVDAEFTGPCFSPDFKTLFLSVQHPGETSSSLSKLTSHWPDGGVPKSAVISIQGPLLEKIVSGKL